MASSSIQGCSVENGVSGDHPHLSTGNEYARWMEEHQRRIKDLRAGVNSQLGDNEVRVIVDVVMSHYDEIFSLKGIGTKVDAFHMLSGIWKTPAERFFMWLGGFRSSELLKILGNHVDPLTNQQLIGICNLQQSSQQAEDALSQGMEALQQSLLETLSSVSMGPNSSANVADYMGHMKWPWQAWHSLKLLSPSRSIEATNSATTIQNSHHMTSCSCLFGHSRLYFSA